MVTLVTFWFTVKKIMILSMIRSDLGGWGVLVRVVGFWGGAGR